MPARTGPRPCWPAIVPSAVSAVCPARKTSGRRSRGRHARSRTGAASAGGLTRSIIPAPPGPWRASHGRAPDPARLPRPGAPAGSGPARAPAGVPGGGLALPDQREPRPGTVGAAGLRRRAAWPPLARASARRARCSPVGGRVQRPVRVVQVRAAERAQVGPAGQDDASSRRHRRRSRRPRSWRCRPGCGSRRRTASGRTGRRRAARPGVTCPVETSMASAPAAANARAISTASSPVMPPGPVGGRDPDGHRLGRGPDRAHGGEDLQRVAEPPGQRAAVAVRAPVGQRRDERGQQVAVRAVQLDQVEPAAAARPRWPRRTAA